MTLQIVVPTGSFERFDALHQSWQDALDVVQQKVEDEDGEDESD